MRLLLNIIWFVLCGWWLALAHLITGTLLCLTIIGIPLGLASYKLIPVALLPLGREIVSVDDARALAASGHVTVGDRRRHYASAALALFMSSVAITSFTPPNVV